MSATLPELCAKGIETRLEVTVEDGHETYTLVSDGRVVTFGFAGGDLDDEEDDFIIPYVVFERLMLPWLRLHQGVG